MQRKWLFVLVELLLIIGYLAFAHFNVEISASEALAILAFLVFNLGIFQMPNETASSGQSSNAPAPATSAFWKPGYSFLLAAGLFAVALALHETPPAISTVRTSVAIMPSATPASAPTPGPSATAGQATPAPTPAPVATPMQCTASLTGLDTLTPGSAAAYDLFVSCPQVAKEAPTVALTAVSWLTGNSVYSAPLTQDQGKTYSWRFILEVKPTSLPAGVVHTLLAPEITTKTAAGTTEQSPPSYQ